MKYKTVIKVFVIAFLLFLLTVALGLKFNWVKYLKEKPAIDGRELVESAEALGEVSEETTSVRKKPSTTNIEIVSDSKVSGTTEEQIKNDCIRASRRAGVGDSEIHAVVRECVELSLRERGKQTVQNPNLTPSNNRSEVPVDSNMSLTRGACEMVVADQTALSTEEKEAFIAQCIQENSQ